MMFLYTASVMNGLTNWQEVAAASAKRLEEKAAAKAKKIESKKSK